MPEPQDMRATQFLDSPPLLPFVPSQSGEEENQQVFVPPMQEQSVSPISPVKQKTIKTRMKKRQRVTKKIVHFPYVLETILEEDEEEEEEETDEKEQEVPT